METSKSELIVSFTHTNYAIKEGGTEKCVTELSKVLQDNGYSHLCFYPFMKRRTIAGKPIVGCSFNDEFIGVIWAKDIPEIVHYYLKKHGFVLNCFHVHHLKRHDVEGIINSIKSFNANIFLFIHDFRFVCISEHFIDSNGQFCGDNKPNARKCCKCSLFNYEKTHQKVMDKFIESLNPRIEKVICPSLYVKSVIEKNITSIVGKAIVRPHLEFKGSKRLLGDIKEIRFAFSGKKREQKGYNKWLEVLDGIKDIEIYKLYYLGIDVEDDKEVKNIYVSTTTQGSDAMKRAIEENEIICAFVWPQCPETYSYVYYELFMSGAYVITNDISGNIKDEVINKGNGRVFHTIEECIKWLQNPENVRKEIVDYRNRALIPIEHNTNSDISMMISEKTNNICSDFKPRKKLLPISTALYKLKYSRNRV